MTAAAAAVGRRPVRILLVDDDPDDRALARHAAEEAFPGARFLEPTDAASLEAALAEGPDLVVTDYALRWTDGLAVLAAAKATRPGAPVVMFTGSGDEEVAAEAMKAGLDEYVVKSPRALPRLRASLRAAVEASRSRASLAETEERLRAALREKDALLGELQHRVKNNLQVAIGLLRLRARRAEGEEARRELTEVSERLRALARVQARVHASGDMGRVDMPGVLRDLDRKSVV